LVNVANAAGVSLAGALQVTAANTSTGVVTLLNPIPPPAIPNASSSQAGLLAMLSGNTTDYVRADNTSQNLISAIQPTIWSVRLRSFNALAWGNCTFEVDQRQVGTVLTNPASGTFAQDRWQISYGGTITTGFTTQQVSFPSGAGGGGLIPGTNFAITTKALRLALTAQHATLAASDILGFIQYVEGSNFRELMSDVSSISILAQSSVANLSFGLSLRDPAAAHSICKLCTLGAANTLNVITLPSIPVWPSAGNFTSTPGSLGYYLSVYFAVGSSFTGPANDTWQNGNFVGAIGQSNFLASPINSTLDLCFLQHEPGPVCTQLMDLDFVSNLDRCQRYFHKTWPYATTIGTANFISVNSAFTSQSATYGFGYGAFVREMAKQPTVTLYSPSNGVAGNVYDRTSGVLYTGATASGIGTKSFEGIVSTAMTAGHILSVHYTADTGW
jgi:hypothetical protein